MTRPIIIGIMGGGSAAQADWQDAYHLGELIAERGWVLLNGGRNSGIMEASARGARSKGGLTVGILPDDTSRNASPYISIPVVTGMGSARNCINVLSSDFIVACPGGPGTLSEIALALKFNKAVVLLNHPCHDFFEIYRREGRLAHAATPQQAVARIDAWLGERDAPNAS